MWNYSIEIQKARNLKRLQKFSRKMEILTKTIFVNIDLDGKDHHLIMKNWFSSNFLKYISHKVK